MQGCAPVNEKLLEAENHKAGNDHETNVAGRSQDTLPGEVETTDCKRDADHGRDLDQPKRDKRTCDNATPIGRLDNDPCHRAGRRDRRIGQ